MIIAKTSKMEEPFPFESIGPGWPQVGLVFSYFGKSWRLTSTSIWTQWFAPGAASKIRQRPPPAFWRRRCLRFLSLARYEVGEGEPVVFFWTPRVTPNSVKFISVPSWIGTANINIMMNLIRALWIPGSTLVHAWPQESWFRGVSFDGGASLFEVRFSLSQAMGDGVCPFYGHKRRGNMRYWTTWFSNVVILSLVP